MADASQTYDVVIIGGGPGGYNAAIRAGQLGLKVACVEMRSTLGGTCLNVGCMPSKALLHASELYEAAGKDFAGIGIEVKPKLNLGQMHKAKDDSVEALTKGIEFLFKKNKVDWLKGRGRIAGHDQAVAQAAAFLHQSGGWQVGEVEEDLWRDIEVVERRIRFLRHQRGQRQGHKAALDRHTEHGHRQ